MEPIGVLPLTITLVYLAIIAGGFWVAWKYRTIYAYMGFFWVFPSAAIVWLNWGEGPLGFGYSMLNLPFVLGTVWGSFVIGLICLPIVVFWSWSELSAVQTTLLVISAIFHASPFLFYFLFTVAVYIWGK